MHSRLVPKVNQEVAILADARAFSLNAKSRPTASIPGCDVTYLKNTVNAVANDLPDVSFYFPVRRCLEGIDVLCRRLFRCSFTAMPPLADGVPGVRPFALRQVEDDTLLGIVYLDLFPRAGKFNHCASFPLSSGHVHPLARQGQAAGATFSEADYQLPRIVLVCNFDVAAHTDGLSNDGLNDQQVSTLFHEVGHCLHFVFSRTRFQHLGGTRGPLDFVEFPSILMEHFAWDPRVLALYCRHPVTHEALPADLLQRVRASRSAFKGLDHQHSIVLALFDLLLAGPSQHRIEVLGNPDAASLTPQELYTALAAKFHTCPPAQGTHYFSTFGHLTTYAAGYYNYLWCTVWASHAWHSQCAQDPLSWETCGRRLRAALTAGNAVDPATVLRTLVAPDDGATGVVVDMDVLAAGYVSRL
jgi:intermediate peptidase